MYQRSVRNRLDKRELPPPLPYSGANSKLRTGRVGGVHCSDGVVLLGLVILPTILRRDGLVS